MISDEEARDLLWRCYRLAMCSTDLSTQNAAFVVDTESAKVVMPGVNNFPHGVVVTDERMQRPLKYDYTEHAERDAIYGCAREGVSTNGKTMVCAWAACTDCARAIINSGIKCLITHRDGDNGAWSESIARADEMLREAGVELRVVAGKIDPENKLCVRRNGNTFYP